jgi:hypothetical protein
VKVAVSILTIVALLAACGGRIADDDVGARHSGGGMATSAAGGTVATAPGGANTGGGSGSGVNTYTCAGPSPAGCLQNACPPNMKCDATKGCNPSSCTCAAGSIFWSCTSDCRGGICVPIDSDAGVAGDCTTVAAELQQIGQGSGTCSAVVRLDYLSRELLAYAFACGSYASTSEATARAAAEADTGYGQGKLLSGPAPKDEWVFYSSPSDFGGVSAVSARSGQTLFGGSIVWSGTGNVSYPEVWKTTDIVDGCGSASFQSIHGFDLRDGSALSGTEAVKAVTVVFSSALGYALSHWGIIAEVVVLLYPRTVGDFDPTTAEWVVIVNADAFE